MTTSANMPSTSAVPPGPVRPRQVRAARMDLLFVIPGLLIFGAFIVWPMVASTYYSLLNWTGFGSTKEFIGLANFRELLADTYFRQAFLRSFYFMVLTVPFQMLLALVLAMILNNKLLKLSTLFRTLIFLPVVTPVAVIAIVWVLLLSPFNGQINGFLQSLHLVTAPIDFLGNADLVIYTLAGIFVWKWTGVTLIYWLAALQTVPDELYEAAKLDGVSPWRVVVYVVMPIIAPFAAVIGLISCIASLNVFPLVQATTEGGPFFSSEVMEVYIFRTAFAPASGQFPRLGYASAASVTFGVAIMALTILQGLAVRAKRKRERDIV